MHNRNRESTFFCTQLRLLQKRVGTRDMSDAYRQVPLQSVDAPSRMLCIVRLCRPMEYSSNFPLRGCAAVRSPIQRKNWKLIDVMPLGATHRCMEEQRLAAHSAQQNEIETRPQRSEPTVAYKKRNRRRAAPKEFNCA